MTASLLVVTGLQREAQIAAGHGVVTLCSGGNPQLLRKRLDKHFSTRLGSEVGGILSFGLAGGLSPDLHSGDIVIATHVIAEGRRNKAHADWIRTIVAAFDDELRVHRGAMAGSNLVLTRSADKADLHEATRAIAVDMESHIAAEYARGHNLPFAAIRAISDPASRGLPEIASNALRPDGSVDVMKVMSGVLRGPGQVPALIAAGIDSNRAFASLRRCRGLLGPLFGLGGPHL